MLKVLKSRDVSIELDEILNKVDGEKLIWIIKNFNVVMKKTFKGSVFEIEDKINNSEFGYQIDWKELKNIAKYIHQTIDLELCGFSINKKNTKYIYRCLIVVTGYLFMKILILLIKIQTLFSKRNFLLCQRLIGKSMQN